MAAFFTLGEKMPHIIVLKVQGLSFLGTPLVMF